MFNIIKKKSVTSTNSELKKICSEQNLPSFSALIAQKQTAGRGQAGNSWESEPHKNLTFSTVLYPKNLPAKQSFFISRIFSLAVKETLDKYIDNVSIKWSNDIYYRDKKICGILIENEIIGSNISSSIIGIGLNVNQEKFTGDAPNPISLYQITNKIHDLDEILLCILQIAKEKYQQFLSGDLTPSIFNSHGIRNDYHNALYRKSGYHTYEDKNGIFQAKINETEDDGTLILETKDKEIRRYQFKEVWTRP